MFDFITDIFEGLMDFLVSLVDFLVEKIKAAFEWIFDFMLPFLKDVVAWTVEKFIDFAVLVLDAPIQAFDQLGAAGSMIADIHGYANTFFDVTMVMGFLAVLITWEITIVVAKIILKLFPAVY